MRRSRAEELALDQLDTRDASPLERMRQERDGLRARLTDAPPDPSARFRELTASHSREVRYRDEARWRRDTAQEQLANLGPIGRWTRRAQRHEIEDRIAGFDVEIASHEAKLAELEGRLNDLAPAIHKWGAWEREHQPDLERLATLDMQIDRTHRLDQVASRDRSRGLDLGVGIEL